MVADLLTIIITHILLLRLTLADYNELLLLFIYSGPLHGSAPLKDTLYAIELLGVVDVSERQAHATTNLPTHSQLTELGTLLLPKRERVDERECTLFAF